MRRGRWWMRAVCSPTYQRRLAVEAVHVELGNDGRAGGGLDLHQPFVEALFSERGALNDPLVCHAHEHAATFGDSAANHRFGHRRFSRAGWAVEHHAFVSSCQGGAGLGIAGAAQGGGSVWHGRHHAAK